MRGWSLALALSVSSCSLLTDLGGLGSSDAGGMDATPDATLGWCANQKAGFCDDFDESPLGALWSKTTIDDGGALALDDVTSTSPPNALVVSATGTGVNSFLTVTHTGNVSGLHCELEVRPELTTPTGGVWIVDVLFHTLDSTLDYYEISFELMAAGSTFYEQIFLPDGGSMAPMTTAPTVPTGTWTHLVMDLDFPNAKAVLTYNGITAMTATLQHPPTASLDEVTTVGIVGNYSPDGGTWGLRFDDVACTFP